jgi:peptidyl-prolyl cis-trans isomerase A (cyclophilin A)
MLLSASRVAVVFSLSALLWLNGQPSSPNVAHSPTASSIALKLDAPADILIDGEKVASVTAAGIKKVEVSPGEHFVEVRSNGRTWHKRVTVQAGMQVAEEVRFAQGPPQAKKAASNSGSGKSAKSSEVPLDPEHFNAQAPAEFKAKFTTTKGEFTIGVHRDWAPNGADRLYNLVRSGFYTDASFFRVVPGFMVQFGIAADPGVTAAWRFAKIQDDPVTQTNGAGYVTFAKAGPDTRTTQLFINFKDNPFLDKQGFSPLGAVIEGMDVVNSLYGGYGESPSQDSLLQDGKAYVDAVFPKLDRIISAVIVDDPLPSKVGAIRSPAAITRREGEMSISGEIARIEHGQHSALPPPVASPLGAGGAFGSVRRTVENGTDYTLTVWFGGPAEQKITLPPKGTRELTLPPGTYKVAARVTAPNVLPFFGVQSYSSGQGYTSHFYISFR